MIKKYQLAHYKMWRSVDQNNFWEGNGGVDVANFSACPYGQVLGKNQVVHQKVNLYMGKRVSLNVLSA